MFARGYLAFFLGFSRHNVGLTLRQCPCEQGRLGLTLDAVVPAAFPDVIEDYPHPIVHMRMMSPTMAIVMPVKTNAPRITILSDVDRNFHKPLYVSGSSMRWKRVGSSS